MSRAIETRLARLEVKHPTCAELLPLLLVRWPEGGSEAEQEVCRRDIAEQEKRYRLVLVLRRAGSEL